MDVSARSRGRVRRRVWELLEDAGGGDPRSRAVDTALILLIGANVAAVVLESVPELHRRWAWTFARFEDVSVLVFTAEYLVRLWASVERSSVRSGRLRWALSPSALIDLAAIAPYYLSAFYALDLRFLRVLRLLRVLKLVRYSGALGSLIEVLRAEQQAFGTALVILTAMMTLAASGIYLVEHEVQPEAFGSIPAAMWWAVATLTTVGYGDVTPITPLGKLFTAVVMIVGVGVVALPTGVMTSGFIQIQRRHRRRLHDEARAALSDGVLTAKEVAAYDRLAEELGVTPEEAREIITAASASPPPEWRLDPCPHCGKSPDA